MLRKIYGSRFDGASVTATSGKWTINGAYGYMTAGRFKKADKEKNGDDWHFLTHMDPGFCDISDVPEFIMDCLEENIG